jgi:hypothetical protein
MILISGWKSKDAMALIGSHGSLQSFQSRLHRMPGKSRTFDTHWIFLNAGKYRQFTHCGRIEVRLQAVGRQLLEAFKESFDFRFGLSFKVFGHHGSGSYGNGTSRADKADVFDNIILNLHIDREFISTERIKAIRLPVCALELSAIPRPPVMIEESFLI